MNFAHLSYLHGKPISFGVIKSKPEDFQVVEDLGYSPDGEGEHVLVRIRKQGCNTTFVAEAIAKYLKISSRDLSYAGMKDRHAVTEQTLCFRLPGKSMPDFTSFNLPGCDILSVSRHQRKIRTGSLAGNAFKIILREISEPQLLEQRLSMIEREGVPNYFGEQRFGHQQHNLALARQWASNAVQLRDKKKRGLLLSAVRSAFFNQVTSERLRQQGNLNTLIDGDAVQLVRSGSWFVAKERGEEWGDIQQRLHQHQLRITGPLPGLNKKSVVNRALQLEQTILTKEPELLQLLEREKVDAARRALLVIPRDLKSEWLASDMIQLQFWLPAGSYATSLVRELINTCED